MNYLEYRWNKSIHDREKTLNQKPKNWFHPVKSWSLYIKHLYFPRYVHQGISIHTFENAKFNSFYWCKFLIQILTFSDLDNKDKSPLFSRQTNWILACFLKLLSGQHFIWVVQRWYFPSCKNAALTLQVVILIAISPISRWWYSELLTNQKMFLFFPIMK